MMMIKRNGETEKKMSRVERGKEAPMVKQIVRQPIGKNQPHTGVVKKARGVDRDVGRETRRWLERRAAAALAGTVAFQFRVDQRGVDLGKETAPAVAAVATEEETVEGHARAPDAVSVTNSRPHRQTAAHGTGGAVRNGRRRHGHHGQGISTRKGIGRGGWQKGVTIDCRRSEGQITTPQPCQCMKHSHV